MRQALRHEAVERIEPGGSGLTAAGQAGFRRREQLGQSDLGGGFDGADFGVHGDQAASF
jgi:hypothetical protein